MDKPMTPTSRLPGLALLATSELEITVGGAITVTGFYHTVAANGGGADNLDTITNGYTTLSVAGSDYYPLVYLKGKTGDTITVRHGQDNIDLPDDTDFVLATDAWTPFIYDGTNYTTTKAAASAGGGETNTASNQGVGGVGVFIQKTGVDLEFKNINAGSAKVTVSDDSGDHEIDIDITEAQIDHNSLNNLTTGDVHTQYALLAGRTGGQTLKGGDGAGDDLTLESTSNGTKGDIILSDLTTNGYVISTGGTGTLAVSKNYLSGHTAPTANDDSGDGFSVGSIWLDTTADRAYICLDASVGSAVWLEITHPLTTQGDILYYDGSALVRLAKGTATQVLTMNAGETAPEWAAGGGGGLYSAVAYLEDQKASGTAGGGASATSWNPRDLNAEVSDAGNIVTISSNTFTPIAGDYELVAAAPSYLTNQHRLRLYNVTGDSLVKEGQNANASASGTGQSNADLTVKFTANGTDAYRIGHYTTTASATNGLGRALSLGSVETYLTITLRKFA
jgi:hypothetical protein